MDIDEKRILAAFDKSHDDVWIEVALDEPSSDAEPAMRAAVEVANLPEVPPHEDKLEGFGPYLTPSQPPAYAIQLLDPTWRDEITAWLERFATDLTAAGFKGRITLARNDVAPYETIEKVTGLQLHAPMLMRVVDTLRPNDRPSRWSVDPDNTAIVANWAQERAVAGCETLFSGPLSRLMSPSAAASAVRSVVPRRPNCRMIHIRHDPVRVDHIAFGVDGLVLRSLHDASGSWSDIVSELVAGLRAIGRHLDLAFVQYLRGRSLNLDSLGKGQPPLPSGIRAPSYRYNRLLLNRLVPDARGVFVVTGRHLERATDVSSWSIEGLGDDRHLLIHPDLDAWYAQPEPDADMLTAARADLGSMIMTPADLEK